MGELATKHIAGTKTGSKEYIRTTELFFDKTDFNLRYIAEIFLS